MKSTIIILAFYVYLLSVMWLARHRTDADDDEEMFP